MSFAQKDTPTYSFFSAGHTYGNALNVHYGLHYPFVDYIPIINNDPTMELGFLTGDVVFISDTAYWDSAKTDIAKLNMPIHIAAGNHDIGAVFINNFQNYYFSFRHNNDLFIVLTPGLNAWNINGNQLDFLISTLDSNYATVNNIFIFLHELIWWSPTNKYKDIKINYEPHYPGHTNYDTVVKPLLLSYPNKITLYAGDLGASDLVSPCMYDSFDNITLIGSGMGGGIRDNIIITEVYPDSVYYRLVAINGNNPDAMGEITDYAVNIEDNYSRDENPLRIFPNPATETISIHCKEMINIEILNLQGRKISSTKLKNTPVYNMDIGFLTNGIYLIKVVTNNNTYIKKIIVQ